jgi:fatty-acid peroxygenase
MTTIPRERGFDSTLALLREGYAFIPTRCRRLQSDIFATRLMLRRVVCMSGKEAASEFYRPDRFTRRGALPPTALRLLQDEGSVALMDGGAHRRRKAMFMSLMTPEGIGRLADATTEQWRAQLPRWERARSVVLFPEVRAILCRAVCAWAGVPLTEREAERRTREFGAMIDGAGAFGPRAVRGLLLRSRTERWARARIAAARAGRLDAPAGSAADVIARHRDADGEPLDVKTAAVELLNVLRPTVAVDRYVTFAALALHEHPECRPRLDGGDDAYLEWFVHEVRRFYPFFPAVGGRVLQEFDWRGHHFARGAWVMLDLYGTLHDARAWEEPDAFRPERFARWDGSPFDLVPQGGGGFHDDHRCAGEWITIELMKRAVRTLTREMRYDVPPQDLRIDLSRMPAIPRSRFVIANVRRGG